MTFYPNSLYLISFLVVQSQNFKFKVSSSHSVGWCPGILALYTFTSFFQRFSFVHRDLQLLSCLVLFEICAREMCEKVFFLYIQKQYNMLKITLLFNKFTNFTGK